MPRIDRKSRELSARAKKTAPLLAPPAPKLTMALPTTRYTKRKAGTLCRVAVQLSREDAGLYMTPQELAAHAVTLVDAAFAARAAINRGDSAAQLFKTAQRVADAFGAQIVERCDLDGMVVGVRFRSGRFTSGAENIFYVA